MTHQQDTLDAGFTVVVDPDRVGHMVDGPCWKEKGVKYIPFSSAQEAQDHGNLMCTKCGRKGEGRAENLS